MISRLASLFHFQPGNVWPTLAEMSAVLGFRNIEEFPLERQSLFTLFILTQALDCMDIKRRAMRMNQSGAGLSTQYEHSMCNLSQILLNLNEVVRQLNYD